jgi:hypothetical protein
MDFNERRKRRISDLEKRIETLEQRLSSEDPISTQKVFIDVDKYYPPDEDTHTHYQDKEQSLIKEFLADINSIIKDIDYENKNGSWNEDIKNNTKDKQYWKGYRYGILSILTDYILPTKEKWQEEAERMKKLRD